ncbi:MAG: PAS domain-containing protein [Anaerolineales bacterium]|nr:PAS domain-containing protein [Anaerolineales bacterium]
MGIERRLLLNKPIIGFMAEAADREVFNRHRTKIFQEQGKQSCELSLKKKDGTLFYAELQSIAVANIDGKAGYNVTMIADITDRKQAEEALLKAGALQSAIFNSANFSSIATDARGVIQIFNVGAERMLGYTAAEVMNKLFLCTALNATESLRSTREDQK